MNVNVKEYIKPAQRVDLTHAVKLNDNYYCFFLERKKDNYRPDLRFFFIISEEGKIEHNIEVPKAIQNTVYFDLFLRNDSVFAKMYMNDDTYYLDTISFEWRKIKAVDDMLYEDVHFYITYLDFGEWGATTWFRDKLSGKEYEIASSGSIINRVDSMYYITTGLSVIKIEDPLKMKQSDYNEYYEVIRKEEFYEGTNYFLGAEFVYRDTTYSYSFLEGNTPKLSIITSFVADNKLYHLCKDSVKTFIAVLDDGIMTPVQTIGEKYSTFNWFYSDRCRVQKDNSQLIKFRTKNRNTFGFIEVNGYEIIISYLNLKY